MSAPGGVNNTNPTAAATAATQSASDLQGAMDRSLAQQAAMQAMTINFQSQTEALKSVSEALNSGHEAKMDALDKVGRASG